MGGQNRGTTGIGPNKLIIDKGTLSKSQNKAPVVDIFAPLPKDRYTIKEGIETQDEIDLS